MSDAKREAKVTVLPNKWAHVQHGEYAVSVAPEGLIHLPRHITVEEATSGDFEAAMLAAADVGLRVKAEKPEALPSRRSTASEREAPQAKTRVSNQPTASIGRRVNRRQRPQPHVPTQQPRGTP